MAYLSRYFCLKLLVHIVVLQPSEGKPSKFGLCPFRSPLLRKSFNYFLFLGVLRWFSSPRSPSLTRICNLQLHGLPHSEISGSIRMCRSPELIAAYHVLRRLSDPRHPPYALSNFKILNKIEVLTSLTSNMSKNFNRQPITFQRDNPTKCTAGILRS
jgi:hypothetical protein